jgi:ferredoxin-NADP reductase
MPRITFRDDDRTVDAAKDDWFYDVCVDARASIPFSWAGPRGRVTRLVEDRVTPADAARTDAYLCGSRGMIEDVAAILRGKGVPEAQIHFENFY